MNIERKLRESFLILTKEYDFSFIKKSSTRWDNLSLLYQRDTLKIKIVFEAPYDVFAVTSVSDSTDWPKLPKDIKYISLLLKNYDAVQYEEIRQSILSVSKELNRKNIGSRKRDELFERLIQIEVKAVRAYLDYLTASDGTA